ncbi:group-specific protein [Paenibacillus lycopersici]|uniref:Group-specific protein n=1 Tax=Paenibacillus lycopersici TaxID=2704462 RepID=A0A6C0G060_9BACL|nr:group-specific protein [Paenibacillus lycopersici]QHT61732.1 group-specific protein [Paenibacillus lycopersici]
MISVSVDAAEAKAIIHKHIAELIKEVDAEKVFWDTGELKRRTCMSWETIQSQFFYDSRFPKFKLGGKWYFPTKATREFLLMWLHEQGGNELI